MASVSFWIVARCCWIAARMGLDGDADSVRQIEARPLAGVLDQPHDITGPTLGLQFFRHGDVEHNDAATMVEGLSCHVFLRLDTHAELTGFEQDFADLDPAVGTHAPIARALRREDRFHLLAVHLAQRWVDLEFARRAALPESVAVGSW